MVIDWLRATLFGSPRLTPRSDGSFRAQVAGMTFEANSKDELILVVSRARDHAATGLSGIRSTEAESVPYPETYAGGGMMGGVNQPGDVYRRVERKLQRNLARYDQLLGWLSRK
jgi:hypothetical protein